MATTTALSTDVYDIAKLVETIKQKYTDIDQYTLAMGIYGYFDEMHIMILENETVMASNYSMEAIPTRAKFERNVICHAVSLGINKLKANPAYMSVMLCIPEDQLIKNMSNNKITIDKELAFTVGKDSANYEYHLDYDIIIKRNLLPSGKYVYTAVYDIDGLNQVSSIISPYLPAIGVYNETESSFIAIQTIMREVTHSKIYKKIIVNNPLENKTINFAFENQLAYFYVEVVEGTETHNLECVYDGLYATDGKEYCNYMYIDEKNIRIKFNRDSYQPRANADVTVHIYTTHGATCNFTYTSNITQNLLSDRFSYDNLYAIVKPMSDSLDGTDKSTLEELKRAIPKQMLMRNSVTTYTDLNNFFNSLNTEYIRLYFLEKVHNQEERLYYSYLLLKDGSNIVPTNTCDVTIGSMDIFANVNRYNYTIAPGTIFYHNGTECAAIASATTDEITAYEKSGFVYFNPFITVIGKNPFLVSYYLNILDYYRRLDFEYINDACEVQFISNSSMEVKRQYFTDRNTYKIEVALEQNIASDFGLISTDDAGNITAVYIKLFGVVYIDGIEYRYSEAKLTNYDDKNFIYNFELSFTTSDIIDKAGRVEINGGLKAIGTSTDRNAYLPVNIDYKIFVLAKLDTDNGKSYGNISTIVPSDLIDGYSLCNVYSVYSGIYLYDDYSDLVDSYITISKKDDGSYKYFIKKMPLVKYTYLNTEARIKKFCNILNARRLYMQNCLVLLEDSFGIDFKFFNTYGPSLTYYVDTGTDAKLFNRVNMSLTFEVKYNMPDDAKCQDEITQYIKDYIENINDIKDLHMSVLQGKVLDKFSEQLVYFQLYDMNGYSNDHQNVYKMDDTDAFVAAHTVPEFLNVNTLNDDSPDVTYKVIT